MVTDATFGKGMPQLDPQHEHHFREPGEQPGRLLALEQQPEIHTIIEQAHGVFDPTGLVE